MNRLDPELKRLMRWSRLAFSHPPEEAPYGFAGRVVAFWEPASARKGLPGLQELAWPWACVALAVIVCGVMFLVNQANAPEPAAGVSSALSFLASNLPR